MAKRRRSWFVYRARNAHDAIVYVGHSYSYGARLSQHTRKHRLFLRETICLEISRHGSRLEARHVEADLIRNCKPRWNRQHPKLIWLDYRCQRCGMVSAWRWSMSGSECLDKSGHGGTFDAPCLGILMPTVNWTAADMELWTKHERIEVSRA